MTVAESRYVVTLTKTAAKLLSALDKPPRARLVALFLELADDPRPYGSLKLTGRSDYRARVGDYRAIYDVNDAAKTVTVTWTGDRRDAPY